MTTSSRSDGSPHLSLPYNPEEREAELRVESTSWKTSRILPARPGDVATIDVQQWLATGDSDELKKVAAALRTASEKVGFYRLVGHGISMTETSAIFHQSQRFHSLSDDTKQNMAMDKPGFPLGGVGYLAFGNRKLPTRSTVNQNCAFVVKRDHRIAFDENQWPKEDDLPGFRSAVERYSEMITTLAKRMLPVYAMALDLHPDFFRDAFESPFFRLRMNYYPSPKFSKEDREKEEIQDHVQYGISPHVDTSFFTMLLTDGTPGLVIYSNERKEWIQLPATNDHALIVNSGELLRQWSNDRFLSARHFVLNPTADRFSVPFFINANSDHRMTCFQTCCGPDNPPKYAPFSYNESQGVVQGE